MFGAILCFTFSFLCMVKTFAGFSAAEDMAEASNSIEQLVQLSGPDKAKINATYEILALGNFKGQYSMIKDYARVQQSLPEYELSPQAWLAILASFEQKGFIPSLKKQLQRGQEISSMQKTFEELNLCLMGDEFAESPNCAAGLNPTMAREVMHFINAELLLTQAPLCKLLKGGVPIERMFDFAFRLERFDKVFPSLNSLHSRLASFSLLERLRPCLGDVSEKYLEYQEQKLLRDYPGVCFARAGVISCRGGIL